jgi:hypothetical protein
MVIQLHSQTMGLFLQTSEAFNGYTLFAPSASRNTYLIDNCGKLVHQWHSDYTPGLSAYLLPNGDLLRTGRIASPFNGGGSGGLIERISWEGDVVWSFTFSTAQYHQHHDIAYMPNGNILVNAWEKISQQAAIDAGRQMIGNNGLWSNYVAEIQPVGAHEAIVVWEWRAFDHLIQDVDSAKLNFGLISEHPERIDANLDPNLSADWLHVNAIDYNADLDQIVLSAHDIHEIWVIDHSTTTAEAKSSSGGLYGKGGDLLYRWGNPKNYDRGTAANQILYGQHDVRWITPGLPGAGSFMVYNNGVGRSGPQEFSTVEVWFPPMDSAGFYTTDTTAAYGPALADWVLGEGDLTFYSSRISGAHRLPNGNTLVCVGRLGQFLEVNANGEKVWEYINPAGTVVQTQGSNPFANDAFRVTRYAPDFPGFDGRVLVGEDPIELQPLPYECEIYTTTWNVQSSAQIIAIYPNPATTHISVQADWSEHFNYRLFDLAGHELNSGHLFSYEELDVSSLSNGIYYLALSDADESPIQITRFVITRN